MATEFISNSWLMPTNANAEANRVSNYSLDFDSASSQYVDVESFTTSGNDATISMWFKDGGGSGSQYIFAGDANNVIYHASNTVFYAKIGSGFSNVYIVTNTGTVPVNLLDGNWHHIAITKQGVTCVWYLDGTAYSPTGGAFSAAGGFTLSRMGAYTNGLGLLEASLTEVSIFDYSLSASQVTELYGTGSAIGNPMAITNGRKPVAYYPLGNSAFNGEFLVPNGAEKDFVFDFNGSSWITTGISLSDLNISTQFTLSLWVKIAINTLYDNIIAAPTSTNVWDSGFGIYLAGSALIFWVEDWNDANHFVASSTLNNDQWYHVCCTFSTSNGLKLYIDAGTPTTASNTDIDGLTNNLFIGSSGNAATRALNGDISNVSIFNTALPATGTESVESLYNYGTPPNIASYSNLQAWWELDASATFDGSNFSIPDASSNSNTGTSSGMTAANLVQSDLIINQSYDPFSLSFDGSNDYIDCGSFSALNSATAVTVSAWFKSSTYSNNGRAISNQAIEIYQSASAYSNTQGRFYYRLRGDYGNQFALLGGTSASGVGNLVDGNWHHLCVTFDNLTTTAIVYEDGVPVLTNTSASGTLNSAASNLYIGSSSASSNFIDGSISNISIYNSALSAAQVTTLYNEAKPFDLNTFAVTPVSWWRLGAVNSSYNSTSSEWTILDEIGTNNGTGSNLGPAQTALSDGVGATGSGLSSGMSSGTNRTGDAPYSDNNAVSYNMSVTAKSTSVPT